MKRLVVLLAFLVATVGVIRAQESRATLAGRVTDQSGAAMEGVTVMVTNTATNGRTDTKTGSDGFYTVPFLEPGPYDISVDATGFEKYDHSGINLVTQQHATENIVLQVGGTTQTVQVTADAPLIDSQTASVGQVLTTAEVENLPSNGRSPIGLVRDEYGVIPKEKHSLTEARPFDNSGSSDFASGGGNSQSNEILLNGVPNMQDNSRVSGFSPEMDAVREISVDDFQGSAVYGDTSNGTINITTKSGTNDFHGTLSEFNESPVSAARLFFNPVNVTEPATHWNQYGGTIGGPVLIPKVFNGRNKLFFFYAFEGFKDSLPTSKITTVPTAAEDAGDFSALLNVGTSYQLYNPYAATSSGGVVTRQPILNNILTASNTTADTLNGHTYAPGTLPGAGLALDPVGLAVLKLYPAPNFATTAADGANNYFSNAPSTDNYYSNEGRLDINISQNNLAFFEIHQSHVASDSGNLFNNIATGSSSLTGYWGGTFDDVQTFSPTLSLDMRFGVDRSLLSSALASTGFNPSTGLGMASNIAGDANYLDLPIFNINGFQTLGAKGGTITGFTTLQFFSEVTKVWGRHTIEIGPDIRVNKYAGISPGDATGSYSFNGTSGANSWVSANSSGNGPTFGSGLAELLLGLPDGAATNEYDINAPTVNQNWYFGGYIQDNWHVKQNLTLTLGLRAEHETPPAEARNRQIIGFNPTATNEVTTPAEAAYATVYAEYGPTGTIQVNPLLPSPSNFLPTGGLIFASPSDRNGYHTQTAYWSPRIGVAWSPGVLHGKTVIRAGFGIFYNPFNAYYSNTDINMGFGFQEANAAIPTTNGYLTPAATIDNPFPSTNPLLQPTGNGLGVNTALNSAIQFYDPNVKAAHSDRWSLDIEQQLGKNTMLDLGYVGARQINLSINNSLSALPYQDLIQYPSAGNVPGATTTACGAVETVNACLTSALTRTIALSPYKGIANNGTPYTSSTTVGTLLDPYSEFSGVSEQLDPVGYANYNMLAARVTQRVSDGLQFNVNFEWSRQLEASTQLNAGGPLWYGETSSDFPIHFDITGTYAFPFGRGRRFAGSINRGVDAFIGGWSLSCIYTWESGAMDSWGNVIQLAGEPLEQDPSNPAAAFNTAAFDRVTADQPNGSDYRTFPSLFMREQNTNNADLSLFKAFTFGEKVNLQLRLDAFNALNRVQFGSPNVTPTSSSFGTITSQANTPRVVQIGGRIAF
ncbi:MAG: carboxypeptidase-like regulatory domain-containing protein [Candidatus Acidiferrales bacterium]